MKKRRDIEDHDRTERWVVSYADFITLLFAFFTTMYAISHVDLGKLERFAGSMKSAFNAKGDGMAGASVIEGIRPLAPTEAAIEREIMEEFSKSAIIDGITVRRSSRGMVVSFEDSVLFSSGSAEVRRAATPLMEKVAGIIKNTECPVVIEGHTDNIPIRQGRFSSNWELSVARAASVLERLVKDYGVRPERLSASGYGEFRPVAPNTTPAGRAKNRRVEIVFVFGERGK